MKHITQISGATGFLSSLQSTGEPRCMYSVFSPKVNTCFCTTFNILLTILMCYNFNTILIILYIYGMTLIWIHILPLYFTTCIARCICLEILWLSEIGCLLRPKYLGSEKKTIVQLVENKLLCLIIRGYSVRNLRLKYGTHTTQQSLVSVLKSLDHHAAPHCDIK